MTNYVLLKFEMDWADEFDAFGLCLLEEDKWNCLKKALLSMKEEEFSWDFGSNEGWEKPLDAYLASIKETIVTQEEAKILSIAADSKCFYGLREVGQFPDFNLFFENEHNFTPEAEEYIKKYLEDD